MFSLFGSIKTTEGGIAFSWDDLVQRVTSPFKTSMTKAHYDALSDKEKAIVKQGQDNIIMSAASRRSSDAIEQEGLTAIALDFDSGEVNIDDIEGILSKLSITQYVVYSTISHSAARPRLRVIIPFDSKISVACWQTISDYLHDVIFPMADKSGKRAAQPWLLPFVFEGQDVYEHRAVAGQSLSVNHGCPTYTAAIAYHQSLTEYHREKTTRDNGLMESPISFFNRHESLERYLLGYGYRKVGEKRFISPYSKSQSPGVTILGDGDVCYSHHINDPLNNRPIDAFELFAHFEHGGDKSKAVQNVIRHIEPLNATNVKSNGKTTQRSLDCTWGSEGLDLRQDWLIKGLIQPSTFSVIYGPSASFKSFIALDMAIAVSTGQAWHGHKTKQGLVVYVAAEGATGVKKRIRARELENEQRFINIGVSSTTLFLDKQADANFLVDEILEIERERGEKVALIVIDTLARCYSGDENSNSDMGRFVNGIDAIMKSTNATVMVVHHSGKEAARGTRGASALFAAADSVFEVKRNRGGLSVTLNNTKQKDAEESEKKCLILKEVTLDLTDEDGDQVTSLIIDSISVSGPLRNAQDDKHESQRNWILAQISERPSVNRLDLRKTFIETFNDGRKPDSRRSAFDRLLASLLEDEQLDRVDDELYPITDD